jgi:hypothetical protein
MILRKGSCRDITDDAIRRRERENTGRRLARVAADKIARALGQGLAQCWSRLPQDIQQDIFEAAVSLEGEAIRQLLAIYLHGKHTRTTDAMHARATSEPDSLGG